VVRSVSNALLIMVGVGDGVWGAGVSPLSLLVEQAAAAARIVATTTERKICIVIIEPLQFHR
jgi:hypothetical protein